MGDRDEDQSGQPSLTDAGHWAGFLVAGGLAFLTDAGVLSVLTHFGVPVLAARLAAIFQAMVVAWLAHRWLTFRMETSPTVQEFLRYAAVAWTSAAINYGVFALILLAWPGTWQMLALFISSIVAMAFSYVGMRFAAFRR